VYDLLVPKNGNAEDVVAALIKKAGIDDEVSGGPIRLYELHSNKIHKEHTPPRTHSVISITDYVTLVAERIPQEDLDATSTEMIHAFHFQNEPNKAHGIPFKFRIKEVSTIYILILFSLTFRRPRSFLILRNASKSGWVSKARILKRSNLPWSREVHIQSPHI
jgi:hypothetical protein